MLRKLGRALAISDSRFSAQLLSRLPEEIRKWTHSQDRSFDALLSGRDVQIQSETGSGKTLGYLLPLVDVVGGVAHHHHEIVVVPTRELASQIGKVAAHLTPDVSTVCGDFRGGLLTKLLICTPGGLLRVLPQIPSNSVSTIVLDEFDRLVDFGFIGPIGKILSKFVQARLVVVSATFPPETQLIAKRVLRPGFVAVGQSFSLPAQITHKLHIYEPRSFFATLQQHTLPNSLILFPTTRALEFFHSRTAESNRSVYALHGRLPHAVRAAVFAKVQNDPHPILFSTDVAARGLDLPQISRVCQVGFSGVDDPVAQFVHRGGRTGRAGRGGANILLLGRGLDGGSKYLKRVREMVTLEEVEEVAEVEGGRRFLGNYEIDPEGGPVGEYAETEPSSPLLFIPPSGHQKIIASKCAESLLSWFCERRRDLGISLVDSANISAPARKLEMQNQLVKAVIDLVRSAGVPQPTISHKLATKLKIEHIPGLLLKHR